MKPKDLTLAICRTERIMGLAYEIAGLSNEYIHRLSLGLDGSEVKGRIIGLSTELASAVDGWDDFPPKDTWDLTPLPHE